MKKYYKVTSISDERAEVLVVANNYSNAVIKLMCMEDFDYLFGSGFKIVYAGELLV